MVTVFGLGFVGLTTALGFASLGNKVYGVDVDQERKNILRKGELPFLEPGMDEVLKEQLNNNFFVTDNVGEAIANSRYIYYCVGTPYGEDGSADLSYLFSAIDTTIDYINDNVFRVLVTKSTIPPSTTKEKIVPYIRKKGMISENIGVANNPEFLREGHCWEDFVHADRIVIGVNDQRSQDMLIDLYKPMNIRIFCVSWNTSEFIKYLSNTLLATLISYANEMSQIAEAVGDIDVADAFHILHMDKRWNGGDMANYAYPGCGYGGYCLPKDTNALYAQSSIKGFEPPILREVISTNDKRAGYIADKITDGIEKTQTIGILGLSFKPLSDDVRDTPAAKIIKSIIKMGYKRIIAYDPVAVEEFRRSFPELEVEMKESAREVLNIADVVAVITAWEEFKEAVNGYSGKIIDCRYYL